MTWFVGKTPWNHPLKSLFAYFIARPSAESASCSGQPTQLKLTCGGDRPCPSVEQLSSTVSEAGTNFTSDKRLGQSFYNVVDFVADRIADESEIRAIHALSTLFTATLPTMASGTRLPGPVERAPASILYDPYPYSVASTRLSGKQCGLLPNAVGFAVRPSVPVWPSKNPNDPESDGGAAHDPQ